MSGGLASCGWLGTSFDTCRGPLMGAGVGCKPHSPDVLPHLAPSSHQASSPHSSTEHQTTLQGCPSHLLSACASTERCRDAQRAGTASPPDASTADTLTPVGSSAASLEAELAMQHAASLHESSGPRGSAAAGGLHTGNSNNSRNGSAGGAIQPGWGVGTLGAQLMGQQQPGLAPLFGVPTPNSSSGMPAASQQQQEGAEAGQGMQMAVGQWQPCSSPLEAPGQQQPQPVQAGASLYDMDMSSWFGEPAPSPNVQQQQQQDQSHLLAQQQQQQQAQGHLSPQQQQQQSVPMSQPWGAGAASSWQGAGATTPACMPMVSAGMPLSSPTPAAAGGYGGAATQQHHSMASPQQPPMGSAPPMTSNMAGAGQRYAGGDSDGSYQEWLHSIAASHPLLARVGDTPAAGTLSPPTSSGMAGGGSPGAGSGSSGSPGAPGGLVGPLVGLLTGQGRQLPPLQLAAAESALHQHLEKAYQAGYLDGYSHGQAAGRATAAAAAAAAAGGGYMPPRPLSGGGAPPTLPGSYRAPPVAWPPPGCHPPRHPAAPGYPPAFGASGAGSHPLGKRGAPHLELPRKRPVPSKLSSPTGGSNSHGGQRQVPPRGAPHPSVLPPPSGELSPQGSGGLQMYPPLASALPPPAFGAGPAHLSGGARRPMPGNARPQRSGPQRPPAPAPTAGVSQVEQLREVATAAAKAALQTPPAGTSSLDREAAAACLSTLSTEELVAMASRVAAAATAGVLPVVPELTALSQGLGCSSK